MSEKNEALRLADMLERMPLGECDHQAAAELRRLHEENAELRKANDAFGQRQEWWNERMVALEAQRDALLEALHIAEAALSDIGDADREPGDDVAWCEARAAEAIPKARAAIRARGEQP